MVSLSFGGERSRLFVTFSLKRGGKREIMRVLELRNSSADLGIDRRPVPGCSISLVSVFFSVVLNLIRSAESKDKKEI